MLLATADANAERAEVGGITALEASSKGGHLVVVVRLLEAGADVNVRAVVEGGTSLKPARKRGHLEVVTVLLEAGADVDAEPAEVAGCTAM